MNKTDLVKAVAAKTGYTQKDTRVVVDALVECIVDGMKNGEVSIAGFGKFAAKEVPERTGRNPQTGAELVIPAHRKPAFKASSALKSAVNA